MRSVRGSGILAMGVVVVVSLWVAAPARGLDFLDDFNGYPVGTVPWPPGYPYTTLGPWTVLDLSAVVLPGAHPFTVAISDTCGYGGVVGNNGLVGMWDGSPGVSPGDNIAVALLSDMVTDATVRMKLRWSCNPGASCDLFEGICRVDSEEMNGFVVMRNRFLVPAGGHPANGTFNCYAVELHDDGNMGIIKAIHYLDGQGNPALEERRIKETTIAANPARDIWMRVEIQTLPSSTGPSVRIRARAWQDDLETPKANDETAGIEDEPRTWNVIGDDYAGRDPWEWPTEPNNPYPGYTGDPYLWDGSVGIGWNEDGPGGPMSDLTLDYVTVSTTLKGAGLAAGDFDGDGDVDLADFSIFQSCFNGPNRPAACR
jgi:hypothetical protein